MAQVGAGLFPSTFYNVDCLQRVELLGKAKPKVPLRQEQAYVIGERVEFNFLGKWNDGIVTAVSPLKVRYVELPSSDGSSYAEVRKITQELSGRCNGGHEMKQISAWTHGTCDSCHESVSTGQFVLECRQCDPIWWKCAKCAPKEARVDHTTWRLEDFRLVTNLGKGAFGTVNQVVHKQNGHVYAMKVIDKRPLVKKGLLEQLKREVANQLKASHVNVVRMLHHFEDSDTVRCVLEHADQGQLYAYLGRHAGGLPETRAAIFFVDTTRGVQYLHSLAVIHRDIKPENILLFTEALTCKIADFGWCVELTQDRPERKTFCGTMDYLAPEMINDEPHDYSLDLWALGVLLYELLLDKAPFVGASPVHVGEHIRNGEFEIPIGSMSDGPAEIIRGLLVVDKTRRWPLEKVLSHPWTVEHGGSIDSRPGKLDTIENVAMEETLPIGWQANIANGRRESPALQASQTQEFNTENLKITTAEIVSKINVHMDDMSKSFQAKIVAQQESIRNFMHTFGR